MQAQVEPQRDTAQRVADAKFRQGDRVSVWSTSGKRWVSDGTVMGITDDGLQLVYNREQSRKTIPLDHCEHYVKVSTPAVGHRQCLDERLAAVLRGRRVGETITFPYPVVIGRYTFTHAVVEHDFLTASKAHLLRLHPDGILFVSKQEDVRQECAVMSALRHINRRWKERGISVFGAPIQVVTYAILPVGATVGLVEVVPEAWTMRELGLRFNQGERHLRILHALRQDPRRLDRLAASTAAYLTMVYALGVRDGHDDNLMLRGDGSLFRVDFGFVFGRSPGLDAPATFVPNAVRFALGNLRYGEAMAACGRAIEALSGGEGSPPGWETLRRVPALGPVLPLAWRYTQTLSLEGFYMSVRKADEWSFSRALKNTAREAIRYVLEEEGVPPEDEDDGDDWLSYLDGSAISRRREQQKRERDPGAEPGASPGLLPNLERVAQDAGCPQEAQTGWFGF